MQVPITDCTTRRLVFRFFRFKIASRHFSAFISETIVVVTGKTAVTQRWGSPVAAGTACGRRRCLNSAWRLHPPGGENQLAIPLVCPLACLSMILLATSASFSDLLKAMAASTVRTDVDKWLCHETNNVSWVTLSPASPFIQKLDESSYNKKTA